MNSKEYIESGILELYVMGSLSATEKAEVEKIASELPEIAAEISIIETALMQHSSSKKPSDRVKQNILKEIQKDSTPIVQLNHNNTYKWLAAASVLLFVISTAISYTYYNSYKKTYNELAALQSEKDELAGNFNTVNNKYLKTNTALKIFRDTANKVIQLKGIGENPSAFVKVMWNSTSKEVCIDITSLPTLEADKQFQLWALADGKPIDAGVFDLNKDEIIRVKNINDAQAFAVTIEPKGGSINPTLSTMVVLGNI
ncbi:MAG: anti-sigma factor [Bacteroidota bacterium]